jgi:hypothetical protein
MRSPRLVVAIPLALSALVVACGDATPPPAAPTSEPAPLPAPAAAANPGPAPAASPEPSPSPSGAGASGSAGAGAGTGAAPAASSDAPGSGGGALPPAPPGCLRLEADAPWAGEGTLLREQSTFFLKLTKPLCWIAKGAPSPRDDAKVHLVVGVGLGDADASRMDSQLRAIIGRRVKVTGSMHDASAHAAGATPPPSPLDLAVQTVDMGTTKIWPH